jgi:hypothetical protein
MRSIVVGRYSLSRVSTTACIGGLDHPQRLYYLEIVLIFWDFSSLKVKIYTFRSSEFRDDRFVILLESGKVEMR